jgi:SAM-dependent methyltransferase
MSKRAELSSAFRRARAAVPFTGDRFCVVCERRVSAFLPFRGGAAGRPALMRALETIGSDVENFSCPRCLSHDRERHLLLYMRARGLFADSRGKPILHVAPERHLSPRLRDGSPRGYVAGDRYPRSDDVMELDVTALPFDDECFHLLLANHVLEHVSDEALATAEMFRVLRPGGYAVLQTPFSRKLEHTFEDPGVDTPDARREAYGQEDHVRLFGRDIFERIAAAGFESHVAEHAELLPDVDSRRAGVNPLEPFFLFQKPPQRR